jgi:hypothetical protein
MWAMLLVTLRVRLEGVQIPTQFLHRRDRTTPSM